MKKICKCYSCSEKLSVDIPRYYNGYVVFCSKTCFNTYLNLIDWTETSPNEVRLKRLENDIETLYSTTHISKSKREIALKLIDYLKNGNSIAYNEFIERLQYG